MRRVRVAASVAVVSLLAAATPACAEIWGFQPLLPASADASVEGGEAGADADGGACVLRKWPARPAADDPGGNPDAGGENGLYWVVDRIAALRNPDGTEATFGYDLDDTCTDVPATSSCRLLQTLPPSSDVVSDLPGEGVDYASVRLLQIFTVGSFLTDESLNKVISEGRGSIMLRLRNYQGVANQRGAAPQLFFGAFSSLGTVGGVPPDFDASTQWVVSSDETGGLGYQMPKRQAERVWIRNDTLVAEYDSDATFFVDVTNPSSSPPLQGRLRITLTSARVVATLVPRQGGGIDLANGVLTGKWRADDMLAAFAALKLGNESMCTFKYQGVPIRDIATNRVCSGRDIATGSGGTSAPCDAISVALAFHAVPARWGGESAPPATTPPPCMPTCGAADAGAD